MVRSSGARVINTNQTPMRLIDSASIVVLEPGAHVIRLAHVVPDLVRLSDR
jgi:hypothetical protein